MNSCNFIAHWIATTRRGWMALKLLEALSFLLGVLLTGWMIYMVETRFFPVIVDWRMDYIERADNTYRMGGILRKTRACELVATDVMAVPKTPLLPRVTVYRVKPHEFPGSQVSTGISEWGPWEVTVPPVLDAHRDRIAFLEVVGVHRCHAFWLQETLYGRVRMEELP